MCITAAWALVSACSKPKAAPKTSAVEASASAETVAAAPSASAAAPSVPWAHKPVDRATLKPPPLSPPPDAKAGEAGIHYQLLEPGDGPTPAGSDAVVLDFSMWLTDGTLAQSSYTEPKSTIFTLASVSPQLRGMLAPLRKGAKVRYWLPRAVLVGWRPTEWPDADLVVEATVLDVSHMTITDMHGNPIDPSPVHGPDAGGPPTNSTVTPNGLHYIYLAQSAKKQPPKPGERLELELDAFAIDGLTVEPLEQGLKSATTLERAPGNLSEVLKHLHNGDRVRIWLPMGLGRQVIPKAGSHDVVLDLAVTFQD